MSIGAKERYGERLTEKHINQLEHELAMITRMQLEPYFLLMHEIVNTRVRKALRCKDAVQRPTRRSAIV